MQVVLEIFLILGAIAQNVVASSLQAWALPWGFPLLVGLFAFYIPLRLRVGGKTCVIDPKANWFLGTLAFGVLLFAVTWLVERYIFYGTVSLRRPAAEKRQGRKSRVGNGGGAATMGISPRAQASMWRNEAARHAILPRGMGGRDVVDAVGRGKRNCSATTEREENSEER